MTFCQQHTADGEALGRTHVSDHEVPQARMNAEDLPLLLHEVNHRIRNFLSMIEAVVGQTQSTTVEEYRAKLMARISGLGAYFEMISPLDGRKIGMAELLQQTIRPYGAKGGRVVAGGPEVDLDPRLALSLHLVFHELAMNANKYGASPLGCVKIEWKINQSAGAARELAIAWTEQGGPEVKTPRHRGFGSRLITRALDGYGGARLAFHAAGLACLVLVNLEASDAADCRRSKPIAASSQLENDDTSEWKAWPPDERAEA